MIRVTPSKRKSLPLNGDHTHQVHMKVYINMTSDDPWIISQNQVKIPTKFHNHMTASLNGIVQ